MALETRERGADRAEIGRVVADHLEQFGAVQMRAVSGPLPGNRITTPLHFPVLATDPDPVAGTALVYAVLTGGKVDLRVRHPTGSPITLSIEV